MDGVPDDAPTLKGNSIHTSSCGDANLHHDLTTWRSASGILHFLNQTPVDSFSKQQNQVESAMYGSELMAVWQAVEPIIDLCYSLHMLSVPLDGPSWLFGDNKSIVMSLTIPHSSLNKYWNALSYHKVCEAVAGGFIHFEHIPTCDETACNYQLSREQNTTYCTTHI